MLLALKPGISLGPFSLGKPLPDVLLFLQQHKSEYRCVEIKFGQENTLKRDILVSFPEHGFQLHFEPRSQRLRLLEVFDTTRLQMVYGRAAVFGGASNAPTFGRLYEAFGPTYPGEPEAEGVALQYPGIMMLFPQPSPAAGASALPPPAGYMQEGAGRAPPSFPVPLSAVAQRIFVHAGTRGSPAAVLAAAPPPLEPGSPLQYMEPVEAVPGAGIFLGAGAAVRFGDCPQDAVCHLGQPARVARKASGGAGGGALPDYFYVYPRRGLDLLFCGSSHRLIKVVLHTNVPGHPDFNAYCKCNFRVHQPGWWPAAELQPPQGMGDFGGFREGSGEDEAVVAAEVHATGSMDGTAGGSLASSPPRHGLPYGGRLDVGVGVDMANADGGAGASPTAGMRGAAFGALPPEGLSEAAGGAGSAATAAAAAGSAGAEQGAQQGEGQAADADGEAGGKQAGGLSAAYQLVGQLVGLIDDVMTLDPHKIAGEGEEREGRPAEAAEQGGSSSNNTEEPHEPPAGPAVAPAAAAAAGKPPKPPAPPPAPPVPVVSKAAKKKKGKKARRAAAAAAAGGGGEFDESDGLADASDSGFDSSLASSPAASSPINCHSMGGRRLGSLATGYQSSDWGSTADLAAKEGSVGVGSALDGWSDADDLFPMVAGHSGSSSPLARAAAGGSSRRGSSVDLAAGGLEQGEDGPGFEGGDASLAAWAAPPPGAGASALTAALSAAAAAGAEGGAGACKAAMVSSGVQTADAAVGDDGAGAGLLLAAEAEGVPCLAELAVALDPPQGWEESESPTDYVIPDRPSLFDEGLAAAEYERVPRQRDCSTQTPAHLLSPRRSGGGGAGDRGGLRSGGLAAAGGGSCGLGPGGAPSGPVVTADSRLEEIEAAFGHQGGPALHNRLGASHPFGPSFLYAYRGVVFEVLQNGLIASVTLFKP